MITRNGIRTSVIVIGNSPRLQVIISGDAVEYMQRPACIAIAEAAANAAGYVVTGTPTAEILGSSYQAKVVYPHYTK